MFEGSHARQALGGDSRADRSQAAHHEPSMGAQQVLAVGLHWNWSALRATKQEAGRPNSSQEDVCQ
jgi:hypothetical protein